MNQKTEKNQANLIVNFLGIRKWTNILSGLLLVVSLVSITTSGFNFGIDFTGGTLVEVQYPNNANLENIRSRLRSEEIQSTVSFFGASDVVLIQSPVSISNSELSNQIFEVLKKDNENITLNRVEFIGPKVGESLIEDGFLAILYATIGILIYVLFRFELRFALSSVLTLVHDIVIVLGIFSLFNLVFDLTVLAAILAVLGYSLNDTIVVFDRIRENFIRKETGGIERRINDALNQTLSRTIMTSLTTLLVLVCMLFFAGEGIFNFALALTLGIVIGTYSSIYVSSVLLLVFKLKREHLLKPEIDDELNNTP